MNNFITLILYVCVGFVGGFCGLKVKIPAGAIIGSMLAVIAFKLYLSSNWELPKYYGFIIQVMIGILVGAAFHPSLLQTFHKLIIPVIVSSVVLVATGLIISFIFHKLGLMDMGTGYLGTSPGAMSVLIVLADSTKDNPAIVTCFHLFRVIFVILTAPIILKFVSKLG